MNRYICNITPLIALVSLSSGVGCKLGSTTGYTTSYTIFTIILLCYMSIRFTVTRKAHTIPVYRNLSLMPVCMYAHGLSLHRENLLADMVVQEVVLYIFWDVPCTYLHTVLTVCASAQKKGFHPQHAHIYWLAMGHNILQPTMAACSLAHCTPAQDTL